MNARLNNLFEILENDRRSLINSIIPLSPESFNHALPGKWSLNQIIAHIITGEKLSLMYMKKKVLGIAEAKDSGLLEETKMGLLKISQRLPFKFRAPAIVVKLTPAYASPQELADDWARERNELKIFLGQFNDDQLKKMIYRHVRTGMMNIQHALLFFREHFHHHLPQIKKLL